MTINPLTIYLIMQIDSIWKALFSLAVFLTVAVLYLFGMAFIINGDDRDYAEKLSSIAKKLFFIPLILFLICTFIPSTKTLAAMIIVPAVVNNETIKGEFSEIHNLAKEAIRNMTTKLEE